MAAEAADVLIKKGKRATAAYIQGVCSSQSNSDITNEVFDSILNPMIPIDDWDTIDWCRWLLAGGRSPEEYNQTVRRYDNATTCGLVWTANFVAYRCRTCGISPCMSLCSECFQRGNHEGHDFNMFRSQAGGACDCGDKSVMRESGFCQRHGQQNQINKPEAPPGLLCIAEALMPRMFLRLIQHLRDNSEPSTIDRYQAAMLFADGFLTMLHSYSEMGAAMRDVMTRTLINPQLYLQLAIDCDSSSQALSDYKLENLKKFLEARNGTDPASDGAVKWSNLHLDFKKSCFLDELVFWTIKFEFPQKLVCLLLNMMPDLNYKEAFTVIFVRHYKRISEMLARSTDSDTLSNRVVHVSVQLFSNEDLAYQMSKDYDLLRVMVDSLGSMMVAISQDSTLQCAEKNEHLVVDCSHRIMKEHCYWPLVSDLNNVLTHEAVAFEFLNNDTLLDIWFRFLSLFQGMNVNQRELKAHVEFESNTYYAAFSAELEASATPMWALISHLKSPETLEKTKNILRICLQVLQEWFAAIDFSLSDEINAYQVSFHLPLHRCFASFLGQAVRQQGASLDSLLPCEDVLKLMMMHPLQAQVAFNEILCNMWVRSGLQIKGQAMTYIQCHFCNSIVDADLFLLQLCAMKLDPDWFLKTVMQRFHVLEWFTFHPSRNNSFLESDKVLPMLEGALSFLCTLLSTHTNIGQTEEEVTRQEMVSLLCMSDRTHSQLMDLLPDKCGATSQNKDFESILNKVADYKAPNFEAGGTMLQGMFVPKPQVWEEEYDPIHVLLRAVHRREYQSSLDRYTQHLRQANKYSGSHAPWPPFRIPGPVHREFVDPRRILHSRTMHGIIFTILHRAVNDPDIPEQILSLCIYLLDMAIRFPYSGTQRNGKKTHKEVEDLNFDEWFDSSETLDNVTHVISRVIITEKVQMSMRMVEEMEVDEEVEIVDMDLDLYDVQSPIVEEDAQESGSQQALLSATSTQLEPPCSVSSTTNTQLVAYASSCGELAVVPSTSSSSTSSSTSSSSTSQDFFPTSTSSQQPAVASGSNSFNMALIPTSEGLATVRPKCLRLKQVPGRHRMLLLDKGLPLVSDNGLPMPVGSESGSSGESRYLPFSNKRTIDVNESILSLLLQLHSKLSEKPDSYRIKPRESLSQESINLRIGDGVTYIERLIDHIAASGEDKVSIIQNIKQRLWPKKNDSAASPSSEYMSENLDKEVKRRRAKERQQKLMAEFASKQKAFMQKTLETDSKESLFEDSLIDEDKEYECVICGQMTASEEERPVGMVILLQATSVVGHYHQNPVRKLPCGDDERLDLQKGKTLAAIVENKIDLLTRHFDNKHWPMALNIGWEGGVHVQSCGHYLHIDCHKSYIQSLKNQSQLSTRLQNIAVDRGEYCCPLCRQLANSVIPIIPSFGKTAALVNFPRKPLNNLASDLGELLSSPLSERESNLLKKYMGGIMEDITHATYPQYRSVCSPNSSSLFLFVCSISRTNLEVELIQRGGTLNNPLKKKSCFVPLLHVLSTHSRFLSQTVPNEVWTRLTGQMPSDHYSVALWDAEVPLLLRDCTALLLQIVLTLPLNLEKAYYRCVIQILYNFLYIQAVVQLSCNLTCKQRHTAKRNGMEKYTLGKFPENEPSEEHSKDIWRKADENADFSDPKVILCEVISQLEHSSLYYTNDDEMDPAQRSIEWTEELMEKFIQDYCLHFLKIASLLQCHLYEEEVPQMKPCESEFQHLCQFLGLSHLFNVEFTTASCIQWAVNEPRILIDTWCQDFTNFANKSVIAARILLHRPIIWYPPALLKLPHNYDDIFKYYHKKPCRVCHSEPKDPSLCLVCGTMVCLRENCCRQQAHYEAVLHSVICGAGTAMYLAVNSSTIIVIRGKRACLWGSVYLDSYGEEDRDLKRGKPLFLSEDRYKLLQQQWINHSFDHTNKRWVWHKDNL